MGETRRLLPFDNRNRAGMTSLWIADRVRFPLWIGLDQQKPGSIEQHLGSGRPLLALAPQHRAALD